MPVLYLGTLTLDTDDYAETGLRIGLVASSGAGKGYATGDFIEEFHDAGYPVVAIDPESELWTFQEVGALVVGGPHKDAPLPWRWDWPERGNRRQRPDPVLRFDAAAVDKVIEFALAAGGMVVFDLGGREDPEHPVESWMLLEEGERIVACFERVTSRARRPIVFVAIEASMFAPQQVPGGGRPPEELAGMALRGRKRGVISIVETQRTQDIQKRVIDQRNERFIGRLDSIGDYNVVKAYCGGRTYQEMHALKRGHFISSSTGADVVFRERRVTHGGGTPTGGGEVQLRERRSGAIDTGPMVHMLREAAERTVAATTGASAVTGTTAADAPHVRELEQRIDGLTSEVNRRGEAVTQERDRVAQLERQRLRLEADLTAAHREGEHNAQTLEMLRAALIPVVGEHLVTAEINMPDGTTFTGNGVTEADVVRLIREHAPAGGVPAQITPVEKLRVDFLEAAAQRLYRQLSGLTALELSVFQYLLAHPAQQGTTSIARGIGGDKAAGGGAQAKPYADAVESLAKLKLIQQYRSGNNRYYRPSLDTFLDTELKVHEPTQDELADVRDRALTLLSGYA